MTKDLVIQMGVTGGVGLIGGSIVAAASAAFPLIALLPVAGGLWMLFKDTSHRLVSTRNATLYDQMASLMKALLEGVQ